MLFRSLLAALCALIVSAVPALGQPDFTPNHPVGEERVYRYDSGRHDNPTKEFVKVAETVVHVKDAAWLRVYFSQLHLQGSSYFRVISLLDGDMQEMDAGMAQAWRNSTAYFNGDSVALELWAAPGTAGNQMALERIAVEMSIDPAGGQGQCGIIGATDDRTLSNSDFACRVMPVGCTATVYCRSSAMVTAGHCLGSADVVQFRVPASLANCNTVNPPAAEQFPVTATAGTGSGVGNDYGVMTIGTNTLGQTPFHRYNAVRTIGATPAVNNPINFFGYGVDLTCTRSQVQQFSSGAVTVLNADHYRMNADLRGGNSGSSVLSSSNTIVGIVTHCNNGNLYNIAQRMDFAAFVTARNNLAGVCNSTLRLIDVQATGVTAPNITVGTADVNGLTSGAANFKRVYVNGVSVNFTAPATFAGQCFTRWLLNGAPSTANPINVAMTADIVLVAEYGACAQPPANNACGNAIDVSIGGTFPGTLVAATNDGTATCGASATSPDVWYTFTAPNAPGRLFVDTCGSHDSNGVDTVVSLLDSCGGTQIVCNDDGGNPAPGCGPLDGGTIRDASVMADLTPGQTVKIRVATFGTSPQLPFTLRVLFVPANDACANAIDVSAGGTFGGTLINATNDGTATCGASATNPDVWYSFTAGACAVRLELDTCGSFAAFGVDTVVSILDACGGTQLSCNDDNGGAISPCGGLDSFTSTTVAANQTVKIRVSKFSGRILAPFTLHVRFEPVAYNDPAACTPEGETCSQITPDNFNGGCNSTPNAFQPVAVGTIYCATAAQTPAPPTTRDTDWYLYNIPGPGTITISGQAEFAARWFLIPGTSCPATILEGPVDTACGNPNLSISHTFAAAGQVVFFCAPQGFSGQSACGVNENYWFRADFDPVGGGCDPDFNCDGNADQGDVECLINVVAGNPGCECQDADFNQDGNTDQGDVEALINVIAGGPCP